MSELRCTGCDRVKPEDDFHRNNSKPSGRSSRCKECQRAYDLSRYHADPAARLAVWRRWRDANLAAVREYARERSRGRASNRRSRVYAPDPAKLRARNVLRAAVYRSAVAKPPACEGCGQLTEKPQLSGHHRDYTKPYDVEWLCPACHGERHRKALP
jgi:hypothetical protein